MRSALSAAMEIFHSLLFVLGFTDGTDIMRQWVSRLWQLAVLGIREMCNSRVALHKSLDLTRS
ncbi:hypothetical protein APHMUC_0055 [Anaplasma phagocytophilum str. ApMUC09]|uniref:Uncharacterized protein n=2 Tax=Anaplasma phagocytophilum TaxID=948 RepID=A0A0F3N7K0_ANAPH|nr:hypothetical protein APHMUC_0055 [Anaplasma phagocytophilum str. ApMUC09]